MDFWEDLVSSRDAYEIKELIPLLISDRRFAFG